MLEVGSEHLNSTTRASLLAMHPMSNRAKLLADLLLSSSTLSLRVATYSSLRYLCSTFAWRIS